VSGPKRLPSVVLANLHSGDPRAVRRFVTAFGDGLREAGGVAVEGATTTTADLDALLGALEAYFGLADGVLRGHGDGGDGELVATLVVPESGRASVGDRAAAAGVAVFVVERGLAVLTAGVLRPGEVAADPTARRVECRAGGVAKLSDFDSP
jgi:hypothetical protein